MSIIRSRDEIQAALAGQYELDRELGRGGMATVYLARDVRHDRKVAIKVLHPELSASLGAERFLREVRVVARLQHPHILPLFDSGALGELLFFVMPLVDGESLRARLDREGALALDEATRVLRHLADALDYAHARGVIHRDIKPENILLSGRQALLADFGVARSMHTGGDETLTAVGLTIGTPTYMSPEQGVGERDLDGRSDVYSLGCVCFEMLTGVPPFQGSNAMSLIRQHIVSRAPVLVGAREVIPPAARDTVARALEKEPADRHATAGDFASALERGVAESRAPSVADAKLRAEERRQDARERVLVLEFTNLAGDPGADWLSTGIAETVSADLNRVAEIHVVTLDAPARARQMAGHPDRAVDHDTAVDLGRSVGAQWVVYGAFQKAGSRLRITTHVTGTGEHDTRREEKIDGAMDEIFILQDRIVTAVAAALRIELTSGEVEQIQRPATTDLTAYEHYARGYRARILMGKESARVAEEHFRAAIALDPNYALAYAGLGALHVPMYIASGRREVLDEAAGFLERAIALDATLGESHAWLAYMLARKQRYNDAEAAARRAIELDPRSYDGWYMLGTARSLRGYQLYEPSSLARAIPPFLRAIHLRSESFSSYSVLGAIYILRGAYGHAAGLIEVATQRELADRDRRVLGPLTLRAILHLGRSELDQAARLLDRAIARSEGADHVYGEAMTCFAYWARGCVAERRDDSAAALGDFTKAVAIAEAHPHRISIGAHWAKAQFGRVRALHRLGRADNAAALLAEADTTVSMRERFVWSWFLGGSDGEVRYERASALATLGRTPEALDGLRHAADACWSDATWLRHDPAFRDLRDQPEVQRICSDAASRVELSPPAGEGGVE